MKKLARSQTSRWIEQITAKTALLHIKQFVICFGIEIKAKLMERRKEGGMQVIKLRLITQLV